MSDDKNIILRKLPWLCHWKYSACQKTRILFSGKYLDYATEKYSMCQKMIISFSEGRHALIISMYWLLFEAANPASEYHPMFTLSLSCRSLEGKQSLFHFFAILTHSNCTYQDNYYSAFYISYNSSFTTRHFCVASTSTRAHKSRTQTISNKARKLDWFLEGTIKCCDMQTHSCTPTGIPSSLVYPITSQENTMRRILNVSNSVFYFISNLFKNVNTDWKPVIKL